MNRFAHLLDRLGLTASRSGKLTLLRAYFQATPDPERGFALAVITGGLKLPSAKPGQVRALIESRIDPELFRLSYDFVGDLAETVALLWSPTQPAEDPPSLGRVIDQLTGAAPAAVPGLLAGWLDQLDADGRWALLKVITGGLRVGVSARLAKQAVASLGQSVPVDAVEEVWHGLSPPYAALFAWIEGRGPRPDVDPLGQFRPLMLAQPLDEATADKLTGVDFAAEYKWDGIRVQLVSGSADRQQGSRLFSRAGEEITAAFPEFAELTLDAVLDGELLVLRDGQVAPFNDLQQRLNRKRVTRPMLRDYPAHIRLYDCLFDRGEDLRRLPFRQRRERLAGLALPARLDRSPLLDFATGEDLAALHARASTDPQIEGLMLKRWDSPYLVGRPSGQWYKWKRAALTADCVLLYAQRGHGKRSSFYSDYTFGALVPAADPDQPPAILPVGKAYSGFTDAELLRIDRYVRENTTERFGPVRAVRPGLVLEIAFDSIHHSPRHKSGLAMRFPRVHRLRWDKPWQEADRLSDLAALVPAPAPPASDDPSDS